MGLLRDTGTIKSDTYFDTLIKYYTVYVLRENNHVKPKNSSVKYNNYSDNRNISGRDMLVTTIPVHQYILNACVGV
jgi:hypothetical protein